MAGGDANGSAGSGGSQTIATVERAADVLVLFSESGERTLGVTEIAQRLALSKAAVHRILASLRTRALVEIDESTRRYSLGPAAFALGVAYQAHMDVRGTAAAELRELSAATHETATLSVFSGHGRIYADQVTPAREIVMSVPLGLAFPLHAGASSKALLAFLPEAEIEAVLEALPEAQREAQPEAQPGTGAGVDRDALREELRQIRRRGYATSNGERQAGAASIAAPVFDHSGRPVAALSVCGPAERFGPHMDQARRLLPEATARVSARLGYRGPREAAAAGQPSGGR